jgi:hypothetical protein
MKRKISILMLCSLLLITTVGTVMAGNPDYSIIEYWTQVAPTFDGEWTSPDEWTESEHVQITDVGIFTYTADIMLTGSMNSQFLVEFFTDTTDDAEDYWQICIDPSNGGGSAPGTGYGRIDIIGHTDIVCYAGDGTGWSEIAVDSDIEWANSISDSPLNSTAHWILELQFNKESGAMQLGMPPNGLRIAFYDASNPDAGVQAWPPDSDVNDPDTWGQIPTYSQEPIPEGLTFGVMALLSSISLLAGSHYLQKRSKKRETV